MKPHYNKVALILLAPGALSLVQPYALAWWLGTDYSTIIFFERIWLFFLACFPAAIWIFKKCGKIKDNSPLPTAVLATVIAINLFAFSAVISVFTAADERPIDLYLCKVQERDFKAFAEKRYKEQGELIDGVGCLPSYKTWKDYLAHLFSLSPS